jgi:hypothetical protein
MSCVEVAMSLEVVNTLGTLLTVAIIAATAAAAMVQLRHLRAGNQITAMLAIGEELSSEHFTDNWRLVRNGLPASMNDPEFRDFLAAFARNRSTPGEHPEYSRLRSAATLVGNAYEELGILVKRGIVDEDMFLDRYSWVITGRWKLMETYIALTREATGQHGIWENFEYLAVISEDWLKANPTTYPVGLRRMKITNPWPIPAATA